MHPLLFIHEHVETFPFAVGDGPPDMRDDSGNLLALPAEFDLRRGNALGHNMRTEEHIGVPWLWNMLSDRSLGVAWSNLVVRREGQVIG